MRSTGWEPDHGAVRTPRSPQPHRPRPGGDPRGLDRCGVRRHHRGPDPPRWPRVVSGGQLRHRCVARPSGPSPDHAPRRWGQHRLVVAEPRAARRHRRGGQRRAAAPRRRARPCVAGVHRGCPRAGPRVRHSAGGGPRRLPGHGAPHPTGHLSVTAATPDLAAASRPAARHPRRTRRRAGGHRASLRTSWASRRSACGRRCRTTSRPCRTPRPAWR
jgi:hypothetical protein